MKLSEIASGTPDYVVYKVSSPTSDLVYYGYCKGDNIKKSFLTGAGRGDVGRGTVKMVDAAGGADDLKYEIVDVFADEMAAFVERNNQREMDVASIEGPSMYPGTIFSRVKQAYPEDVKRWTAKSPNLMTAREAMDAKYLDFKTVQALAPRGTPLYKQIVADMDKMLYPAFKAKYFS